MQQQYTQQAPQGPEIPQGFTVDSIEEYQPGKPKLVVRFNGVPTNPSPYGGEYWHMEREEAVKAAWQCHYEMTAEARNKGRSEEDCILAWRLPNGEVYTVDHLDRFVPEFEYLHVVIYPNDGDEQHVYFSPLGNGQTVVDAMTHLGFTRENVKGWERIDIEEITINSHRANYEIANLLCQHCGCSAVDDDILYKYRLLNEGWNTDGFYDDEDDEFNEETDEDDI